MKMFLLAFLFTISTAFGQTNFNEVVAKKVTVNGKIEVNSTTEASRPCPPMTEAQRNAISSPATSGCVYNTSALALNVWNGTTWGSVGGGLSSWATAFNYNAGDVVIESNKIYKCLISHTSGTFATDLANGDWIELSAGITSTGTINDNRAVRYDGTTGNLIQSSGVTIDDSNNVSGIANLTATGTTTLNTSLSGVGKFVAGVLSASTILNADINASAAIDYSKLASLSTGQMIFGNAGVATAGTISGGFTINNVGVATLGNTAVTGQLITGYSSAAGTVAGTDTILQAINKLNGNTAALTSSTTASLALKQDLVTILSKGDLYVGSASGATQRLGTGSNGQVLQTDNTAANNLSYRTIKENLNSIFQLQGYESTSIWIKGNNATVVPGTATGSMAGTHAITTNIYTYTQASGSLNDYNCSPVQTVKDRFAGKFAYLKLPYSYNGTTGDLELSIWDVTGTAAPIQLNNSSALSASPMTNAVYTLTIPTTATSLRFCYQVKTVNNGKVFTYSDVQLSDSLYGATSIDNKSYMRLEVVNSRGSTDTGVLKFDNIVANTGTGLSLSNTTTNGSIVTVLANGKLAVATSLYTSAGSGEDFFITKNTTQFVTGGSPAIGQRMAQGTISPSISNSISSEFDVVAGDKIRIFVSGTDVISPVNSTFTLSLTATSNAVALPVDQVSSDSLSLAHKTTAILASDPVGTYNTYSTAANTNTQTICATAPTQAVSSMNANGVQLTGRAFNAASVCATPAKIVIKIGTGMKSYPVNGYSATGKASPMFLKNITWAGSVAYAGTDSYYNDADGTLTIDVGYDVSGSSTTRYSGYGPSTYQVGYFTFNASKSADIAAIPDVTCASIGECTDVMSAYVSSAGVVTAETFDFINGNITPAGNSYTIAFNSGVFTVAPNCTVSAQNAVAQASAQIGAAATTSSVGVFTQLSGSGSAQNFYIECQKTGADSRPKTVKLATSIGVPTVPGIVGMSTGERMDMFNASFGTTNATTVCSGNPCSYFDPIGPGGFSAINRNSTGDYQGPTIKTYTNLKCWVNTKDASTTPRPSYAVSCKNCNTINFKTRDSAFNLADSLGDIFCWGTY